LFAVAAADGTELYVFDAQGRHSQTLDALTGGVLFEFGYDGNGWLTSVTDGDGKVTQIERDGSGRPTAIVGPFGQQTDLSTDANGFLSGITNPAGEQLSILSTPGGLVKRTTDPRGRISNYAYDSGGRLVSQSDNAGYSQELVRTDSGADYSITRTSGMGRSITYDVNLASGNVQNQLVTAPDGSTQSTHDDIETGSSTFTSATGMVVSQQLSADPRFSMQSPIPATSLVSAPGGPTFSASSSREALLIDSNDPLSLISTSNAVTIDGRTSNRTYDASSRTEVITHPTGRTETTTIDSLGRATSYQFADLALLTTTYNGLGQLEIVSAGAGPDARTTSYTYAADGYRQTRTNALGRTTSFLHDAAGRLISKSLPGAVTTIFGYNAAGDLDSIVPPGRPEHTFNYTLHGQLASITPPAVTGSGPTVFTYNDDLQLTSITHPGDEVVEVIHDNEGRVQSLALSRGGVPAASYSYTYLVADQIDTIFGPGSQTLSYAYQGGLVTTQAWGGVVEGSVSWAYDNAFRVVSETVAGGASIAFNYDDDDLLTGAGDYAIVRSAVNGLSQSATIGVMQDSWTHNMFGEVESFSAFANAAPIYATSYSRNKLGQITQKVETIEGITDVFDYEYDELDQLIEVRKNNFLVESYAYDDNGNRLSGTINGNQSDGVYDSQDRLLSYGNTTFEYTGAGRLLSRTETGGVVTDYDYDVVGNLLSVTLPDTTEIAYGHDGADRVVQRAVGASISHRFLYEGILPIAKLDEFGNVIGQYVYVGGNAPVYIIKNGSIYRVITDQVRSVRLVVDVSDGSIVQRLDYDSFGNVLLDTNPGFQPFGFAGGLYDPATHLLRFGLRDYDPATGRWVAKDPIGFSGKDTNLYRYVGNDPVNRNDPIGLGPSNPKGFFDFLSKFGRYKEAKAFVDKLLGRINKIGEGVTHIEEINENLDNDKRPPDESARDFFRSAIESCRLVIKTFGGPLGTLVDKYAEIGQTALDVTVEKGNEYFDKGNLQLCAQSEGEICDMW
jgi:RHS repeat-associated protein